MYRLTLTNGERAAIDWVGGRYRHGDELFGLLISECEAIPDDVDWDAPETITFTIPEHVAWAIGDIVDEGLDCFADELVAKLRRFRDGIV